ncbi:MAG: PTS sugar transporter subunit IIA [Candidatus Omnitrophota bacterium]
MEKSVLTTQELSKYLKLNEKTILKMAQSGELPGFKLANQWRFYLSSVDEYLQDKIIKSSYRDFSQFVGYAELMPLSRLVESQAIILDLQSDSKDGVLYELSKAAKESGIVRLQDELFRLLRKRESMLSTAIGNGVAIPHPRNPSDELFIRPSVVIGRSIEGVDFSSPDRMRTHLFFMTCAPDVVLHLKLLSKVAKLLDDKKVIKKFLNAKSEDDFIKILLKREREYLSIPVK